MKTKNIQRLTFLSLGLVIGISLLALFTKNTIANLPEPDFHEHANFAVFINGEKYDFSKLEFMHVKPCVIASHKLIPTTLAYAEAEQAEPVDDRIQPIPLDNSAADYIHLHDNNGGTIHIHKEGMQYHELFSGISMVFTNTSFLDHQKNSYKNNNQNSWRFFVNNQEVETLLNKEVRDLDRVLMTFGPLSRSAENINQELIQVPNNACVESGSCKHRGYTAPEMCGENHQTPLILKLLGIKN